MNRCNICLEETCNGLHNCQCEKCSKVNECYRYLHATIRITNKCTQECEHCCFECSPRAKKMMTIEKAKEISLFLQNNLITSINITGGEFSCNKQWYEIIKELTKNIKFARIVSNGDWVTNTDTKSKLLKLKNALGSKLVISISNDRWHTNKYVEQAELFLKQNGFIYNIEQPHEATTDSLVPIGRAEWEYSIYKLMSCYCNNPTKMYSFIIDESGEIYKCPFGVWDYANVSEYLNGGFDEKFKEFNVKFYKLPIMSCGECVRVASRNNRIINK